MVEKIDIDYDSPCRLRQEYGQKINEIIDDIRELKALYKEYYKSLTAAIESINVHERQIDKLQMMLEPHKCEPRPENVQTDAESRSENVQDPFAEQRGWIGKLCKFWNDDDSPDVQYGELVNIWDTDDCPFQCGDGEWYEYCEPVKPDDPIIYKGE